MRAEKRKKNAPKELARLKQALSLDKKSEEAMADIQEIATVVPAKKLKKQGDVEMAEDDGDGESEKHPHCSQVEVSKGFLLNMSGLLQRERWSWTASATRRPC